MAAVEELADYLIGKDPLRIKHHWQHIYRIMPHCAIGPVALAACLQVDAAVPNFLIQEQVDFSLGYGLLREDWPVRGGYIELPTRPGLGLEIDEREAERNVSAYMEELGGEHYYESDGSVADW